MIEPTWCLTCYGIIDPRAKRCPHCAEWLGEGKDERGLTAQRVKFQWFLFLLPALYAVTYGVAYGILILMTHQ